jgi:hypothetical protein
MRVWVCHLPKGASARNLLPQRLRPRNGVMLVFTPFGGKSRVHPRFLSRLTIEEDEPGRLAAHEGLAAFAPFMPGRFHIGALSLRCQQQFFYM